ncbi:MAG: ABC transporter permease [Oscillospiraceae bacterium]
MSFTEIIQLIQSAIWFGTVILLGAVGEILTEKSGNLNLGVPGIMYLGGIAGLVSVFFYELNTPNPNGFVCLIIAMVSSFAAAALGGLLFSFLTTTLRVNQNVTGLTLNIFAGGLANFLGGSLNKLAGGVGQISVATTSAAYRWTPSFLSNWGGVGQLLSGFGFMVYLAIILALVLARFLNHSRTGLNLRSVGENPATADAAGINVTKYKYLATCIGSGITGLGGLYYVMDYTKGTWDSAGGIESLGWLALALVIFASWKSLRAILGAYLFGALFWLYMYIDGLSRSTLELFKMLPYVVTLVVLIVVSVRKKKENQPPAHLGLPYFREER